MLQQLIKTIFSANQLDIGNGHSLHKTRSTGFPGQVIREEKPADLLNGLHQLSLGYSNPVFQSAELSKREIDTNKIVSDDYNSPTPLKCTENNKTSVINFQQKSLLLNDKINDAKSAHILNKSSNMLFHHRAAYTEAIVPLGFNEVHELEIHKSHNIDNRKSAVDRSNLNRLDSFECNNHSLDDAITRNTKLEGNEDVLCESHTHLSEFTETNSHSYYEHSLKDNCMNKCCLLEDTSHEITVESTNL